jgi:hypothetical protein
MKWVKIMEQEEIKTTTVSKAFGTTGSSCHSEKKG